jgi:hypothetical protein
MVMIIAKARSPYATQTNVVIFPSIQQLARDEIADVPRIHLHV